MTASQTFSVIVDDREAAAAVLETLRRRADVVTRVQRLPLGDYRVDEALLFERKTLPDLVASIKDGRLFTQGLRLANAPLRTAVILEGTTRDLGECRMHREAIQGALIALTLFLGIPLLRSMDAQETAGLILFAARQARTFAAGALPRKGLRPRGKARVQHRILQGLPGIGPARAKGLLERFGTIEAVMAAPAADLATVPGIGERTAKLIRWAVAESAATYGPAEAADPDWPF